MGESGQRHVPAALLPPEKGPPVPIVQETGWAPEPVWTQARGKILFPRRGSTPYHPVVQPVVRHHTAWANPACPNSPPLFCWNQSDLEPTMQHHGATYCWYSSGDGLVPYTLLRRTLRKNIFYSRRCLPRTLCTVLEHINKNPPIQTPSLSWQYNRTPCLGTAQTCIRR
jgi:hypothetical protein